MVRFFLVELFERRPKKNTFFLVLLVSVFGDLVASIFSIKRKETSCLQKTKPILWVEIIIFMFDYSKDQQGFVCLSPVFAICIVNLRVSCPSQTLGIGGLATPLGSEGRKKTSGRVLSFLLW